MNEEELAQSFIEKAKSLPDVNTPTVHAFDEAEDLNAMIRNEALRVRGDYRMATDAADRHELQRRYARLDRWMGELIQIEAMPDRDRAEAQKRELRAEVLDDSRKWRSKGAYDRRRQEELDAKQKDQREKAAAGAGSVGHRRIKNEIELLLKNYSPANEAKIETLIDKWRRSGDPSYDPSVALKLRNARNRRDRSKHAL